MHRVKIHLIDAPVFVFRAYFAIPPFDNSHGQPIAAVLGFTNFLIRFIDKGPQYAAFCFDESLRTSFRNRIYPAYKSNRENAPEELKRQFTYCKQIARLMGIAVYSDKKYEADDLIGTLLHRLRMKSNVDFIIYSHDKDYAQLLKRNVHLYDPRDDKRLDQKSFKRHWHFEPGQMVDFLALCGDAVDAVPGVKGIGSKTALWLIKNYGSLEGIYQNINKIPHTKYRGAASVYRKLRKGKRMAFLSRKLIRISTKAPIKVKLEDLHCDVPDWLRLEKLFKDIGLARHAVLCRERLRNKKSSVS